MSASQRSRVNNSGGDYTRNNLNFVVVICYIVFVVVICYIVISKSMTHTEWPKNVYTLYSSISLE